MKSLVYNILVFRSVLAYILDKLTSMQTQKGTSKTDNPETYQTAVRINRYVNKMKEQEILHCQNRFQNPIRKS